MTFTMVCTKSGVSPTDSHTTKQIILDVQTHGETVRHFPTHQSIGLLISAAEEPTEGTHGKPGTGPTD